VQSFKDNTSKPVIHFVGKEKQLVCNKTNWNAIVEATGEDDSDNWNGLRIQLVVALVDFQGKRVPAIRVQAPQTSGKPKPVQPVEQAPDDSDIPFSWMLPFMLPAALFAHSLVTRMA
jgi:hypothetical protein